MNESVNIQWNSIYRSPIRFTAKFEVIENNGTVKLQTKAGSVKHIAALGVTFVAVWAAIGFGGLHFSEDAQKLSSAGRTVAAAAIIFVMLFAAATVAFSIIIERRKRSRIYEVAVFDNATSCLSFPDSGTQISTTNIKHFILVSQRYVSGGRNSVGGDVCQLLVETNGLESPQLRPVWCYQYLTIQGGPPKSLVDALMKFGRICGLRVDRIHLPDKALIDAETYRRL